MALLKAGSILLGIAAVALPAASGRAVPNTPAMSASLAALAGPGSPASPSTGSPATAAPPRRFVDATAVAGLAYVHRLDGEVTMPERFSGGLAAGDYDGDGWVDLLLLRGDAGPPVLLHNERDGTFAPDREVTGLEGLDATATGPTLGDFTGDGRLDLVVGAVRPGVPRLFEGTPRGFREITGRSALFTTKNTYSSAMADVDRDGDLDLLMAHWDGDCRDGCGGDHVWANDGDGAFSVAGSELRLPGFEEDFTFTPNFADIDSDGWPDVLMAADFDQSAVYRNVRGRGFEDITDPAVITDDNGMGAAVGDYDNDGDLDWFVSSIRYPQNSDSGNRLYRNDGTGVFEDVSAAAGVRKGGWGWGSCFADFDNDGWLDIFHVNGWHDRTDRSKLFLSQRDGTFRELSHRLGIDDRASGRGVSCFDYDRDGDVDIFVSNFGGSMRLYRNDGDGDASWLGVRLRGPAGNVAGVGARVTVRAGGLTQMRELRCGSNYVSQDPTEAHFGLGNARRVRSVRVEWPDGHVQRLRGLAINGQLSIEYDGPASPRPAMR